MDVNTLEKYFRDETAAFPGKTAYLLKDLSEGKAASGSADGLYIAANAADRVVSASTIKVPVMMALLHRFRTEGRSLAEMIRVEEAEILPDSKVFQYGPREASFYELLVWMIVNSDNTASNVLMDYIGFEELNRFFKAIGLRNTSAGRKMLDFNAIEQGRNNYISLEDFYACISHLYIHEKAGYDMAVMAMSILRRNRDFDILLRYIYEDVRCAHKSGGLDDIVHEGAVFETEYGKWFLGVFISGFEAGEEGVKAAERLAGRLSRKVMDFYEEKEA